MHADTSSRWPLVAHVHDVPIGGTALTSFAGIDDWLPEITGRMLDETLGTWPCALMLIGFNVTVLIQHTIGIDGVRRRAYACPDNRREIAVPVTAAPSAESTLPG